MGRLKGSRNTAYDVKRAEMLRRMMLRPADRETGGASFRELAAAAGASFSTAQHYFGDREGVVAALLAEQQAQGRVYLEEMAASDAPFPLSVRKAISFVLIGFHAGLGVVHLSAGKAASVIRGCNRAALCERSRLHYPLAFTDLFAPLAQPCIRKKAITPLPDRNASDSPVKITRISPSTGPKL